MSLAPALRKIALRVSVVAFMLASGLTLAFGGMSVFYLVVGGPDRLRREASGELPAQRKAAGQQLPFVVIAIAAVGLGVGLGLGIALWRIVARRAGLDRQEIHSVLS